MTVPRSPVPQEVSTELRRVVERWHLLPLDHTLSSVPAVRSLLESLAPAEAVPDLGPGVLMDQLTVLVYDTCAREPAELDELRGRLEALRQSL